MSFEERYVRRVAMFLAAVSLLASYLPPPRRASSVQPLHDLLRWE